MKHLNQKLIIVFSLFAGAAFGHKDTPEYSISKDILDINLQKTEAVFTICFSADGNNVTSDIKFSYNGIDKTTKPDANGKISLKVKPGKYLFRYFYTVNYLEIATDSIEIKPCHREEIQVRFKSTKVPIYTYKPVIFVYPKESTEVKITLDLKGKFLFTYPEYNDGWNFTADPNGTIHMGEKKYDYLFWDGSLNIDLDKINWNEGFVVKRENQVKFFEDKLARMGLSPREIEDFITFWCPLMAVNEMNYIHFVFNEEYNEYAKINITPKPDNLFRVYMMWSKIEHMETAVVPLQQDLSSFTRSGFTVVEWGGTEVKKLPVKFPE